MINTKVSSKMASSMVNASISTLNQEKMRFSSSREDKSSRSEGFWIIRSTIYLKSYKKCIGLWMLIATQSKVKMKAKNRN